MIDIIFSMVFIMPRTRPSRFKPRAYKRYKAARTIGRAWRARKRAKTGLLARTALSNRRAIKTLNKSVETKMIDSVNCSVGTNFGGQFCPSQAVDSRGWLANVVATPVAVMMPWYGVSQGDGSDERTGDYITMKSLTYKINFICANAETNRVGCYIVLDTQPSNSQPSLAGAPAPLVTETILATGPQASGVIPQKFQNLDTCSGPQARYKVLKHIQTRLSKSTLGTSGVGPLKPSVIVTGTLKSHYKIRYDGGGLIPANQNLLFCFYSDSGIAPHPTFDFRCRFRYKDA